MKLFKKDIGFIQNQRYMVIASLILTIGFLTFVFTHGLKFGIDFTGGIKLIYKLNETADPAAIQSDLSHLTPYKLVVQQLGTRQENNFVVDIEKPDSVEGVSQKITQSLESKFGTGNVTLLKEEAVGPKAGQELKKKGQMAIIIAWILILIYLGFRFDFYFSPGAIIALVHDLIITLGAFALLGREISLTVVAAFLTMIGYSVNDTIIVYDRIRENLKKHPQMPITTLVNQSINETLSRTIVTSIVMLFVVVVLFLKGEGEIRDFALAMIIGVVTGTYSSIFIASPIYLFLKKHSNWFNAKESKKMVKKQSRA